MYHPKGDRDSAVGSLVKGPVHCEAELRLMKVGGEGRYVTRAMAQHFLFFPGREEGVWRIKIRSSLSFYILNNLAVTMRGNRSSTLAVTP